MDVQGARFIPEGDVVVCVCEGDHSPRILLGHGEKVPQDALHLENSKQYKCKYVYVATLI